MRTVTIDYTETYSGQITIDVPDGTADDQAINMLIENASEYRLSEQLELTSSDAQVVHDDDNFAADKAFDIAIRAFRNLHDLTADEVDHFAKWADGQSPRITNRKLVARYWDSNEPIEDARAFGDFVNRMVCTGNMPHDYAVLGANIRK